MRQCAKIRLILHKVREKLNQSVYDIMELYFIKVKEIIQ